MTVYMGDAFARQLVNLIFTGSPIPGIAQNASAAPARHPARDAQGRGGEAQHADATRDPHADRGATGRDDREGEAKNAAQAVPSDRVLGEAGGVSAAYACNIWGLSYVSPESESEFELCVSGIRGARAGDELSGQPRFDGMSSDTMGLALAKATCVCKISKLIQRAECRVRVSRPTNGRGF